MFTHSNCKIISHKNYYEKLQFKGLSSCLYTDDWEDAAYLKQSRWLTGISYGKTFLFIY